MKTVLFAAVLFLMLTSCKKGSTGSANALEGIWVESTLRLDTLDFEINNLIDNGNGYRLINFKTNTYTDIVLNPNYPVNHSSHYDYYLNNQQTTINLRSYLSSYGGFYSYAFSLSADAKSLTVDKFYLRRNLPATIEFVRIR
jgi:hypothetical protein